MRAKILIVVIAMMPILTFGQKPESNGLSVEFESYEVNEQEVPLFGKQTMIMGTVIIKQGKKKIATHDFIAPLMKGEITHIAVLDSKGEKIFPRLHFVPEDNAFTYDEGTENAGKEMAIKSDNQKDIVLSGLLVWTKLKYKK